MKWNYQKRKGQTSTFIRNTTTTKTVKAKAPITKTTKFITEGIMEGITKVRKRNKGAVVGKETNGVTVIPEATEVVAADTVVTNRCPMGKLRHGITSTTGATVTENTEWVVTKFKNTTKVGVEVTEMVTAITVKPADIKLAGALEEAKGTLFRSPYLEIVCLQFSQFKIDKIVTVERVDGATKERKRKRREVAEDKDTVRTVVGTDIAGIKG